MSKHAGGRPSKYDPKFCKELIDFFDEEPFTDIDIPHMGSTGEFKWMDYKRMANKLPTVRNFCKRIGIDYTTFYEWVKKHEMFSHAFTHAQELRKWFLIENGLNGCYNPAFAIFVAKNITDMRDKNETEVSGNITVIVDESLKK